MCAGPHAKSTPVVESVQNATADRGEVDNGGDGEVGTGNFRVRQCDTDCRMCGLMPEVDETPHVGRDWTPEERRIIEEETDRLIERVNRRFRKASIDSHLY